MRFLSPIPDSDGFPRLGSSPLRQSRRLEKPEGLLTPNGFGSAHRTRLSPRRRQGEAPLVATVARSRPTEHLRVSTSSPKAPQRTGLNLRQSLADSGVYAMIRTLLKIVCLELIPL